MNEPRVLVLEDLPECGLTELFVPTTSNNREVELRTTARGALVVAAYSSLESLVVCCGWGQPWVIMRPDRLASSAQAVGATEVALDVPLPEGHRYPDQPDERTELEPLEPSADLEIVYIPSRPFQAGQRRANLELQLDNARRRLLLVYPSPEALAEGCGPYQPWVAVDAARLPEVARQAGADGVVFNSRLVESARYQSPVRDWMARDN